MSNTVIIIIAVIAIIIILSLFFRSGRTFWSAFVGIIGDILEGIVKIFD